MQFNLYNDVKTFYRDTYDVLMRHEAQNLIPLGNVIIGNDGRDTAGWKNPAEWFMATITSENGIVLTAIMTPPHNLTPYATDNKISDEAISCLTAGIIRNNIHVPGILADAGMALRFAKIFSEVKGVDHRIHEEMRIYELVRVNPDIPLIGKIRLVENRDMPFLPYWVEGFQHDCFGESPAAKADIGQYKYWIDKKKLYVLEHEGAPVSMAQKNREMQTVCGVGQVYTPPYFRGKGYASSCVAQVSDLILKSGFKKCVLYTNLANPVSNSIYQKIGYVPICDSLQIKFGDN